MTWGPRVRRLVEDEYHAIRVIGDDYTGNVHEQAPSD